MKFLAPSALLLASQTGAINFSKQPIVCDQGTECYEYLLEFSQAPPKDPRTSDGAKNVVSPQDCKNGPGENCFGVQKTNFNRLFNFHSMTEAEANQLPPNKNIVEKADNKEELQLQQGRFLGMSGLSNLDNYGCWCRGNGQFRKGRGDPVDDYDAACKSYWLACECIENEYRLTSEEAATQGTVTPLDKDECVVQDQLYNVEVDRDENGGFCLHCSDPEDSCEYKACMIDLHYVVLHWTVRENGSPPDFQSFSHDQDFDRGVCRRNGNCTKEDQSQCGRPRDFVCCGEYPFIRFYNYLNDNKECCEWTQADTNLSYGYDIQHGNIYNPAGQCCGADGVADIGDQAC